MKTALIIVDMQHDFIDGSLKIDWADKIIPEVNELITKATLFDIPVIFTKDWHQPKHSSFVEQGGRWPAHCVADTEGAKRHKDMIVPINSKCIRKGYVNDAYSGFEWLPVPDTPGAVTSELLNILKQDDIVRLVICGLALDYCVASTAIDAIKLGFKVAIPQRATLPISTTGEIYDALKQAGIMFYD